MDDNTPALPRVHGPSSYGFSGKVMFISVVIFFSVCFVMACFHSYARWVLHRRASNLRRHNHRLRRAHHLPLTSDTGPHQGLDPSVLKSLPTFLHASAAHDPPLECAVCLSEFEDKEMGRVLPKCNHCFHIDCIDMWFHSHSNCPICRAPVQAAVRVQPAGDTGFTILSVTGSSGSEEKSVSTHCPDSSSSLPADGGRKLPESMTITVEVHQ